PGNVFNLVASVQSVVDKYVQCVIERYLYHHRLDELCSMTKKSNTMNYLNSKRSDTSIQSSHKEKLLDSNSSSQLSSNDQGLDKILTIEPIIVEMLQMITLKVNEISQFFNNCQIIRQVQDLLGKYLILEEYYLRVTITKFWFLEQCLHDIYPGNVDVSSRYAVRGLLYPGGGMA
ncbi:unnamed protein product, partial [Trichobilharzia regenti]